MLATVTDLHADSDCFTIEAMAARYWQHVCVGGNAHA